LSDLPTDDDGVPIHPLEKLKRDAEEARKRQEKEVVSCPECDTEVLKDDLKAAIAIAEGHDESRHDGERTAEVNGMLPPSDELVEAAEQAINEVTKQ